MSVKIETTDETISVTSEYNSEFVDAARNLNGKWKAPAWVFDIRDEDDVRAACMKFYGEDGLTKDKVDVKVTFIEDHFVNRGPISISGKVIAKAFGRDSGAKLGEGVVLKEGKFRSGGSVKNWETKADAGTVVIVRDVSRAVAESTPHKRMKVEIISSTSSVEKDALKAEKEKLLARITEIDSLLESA